VPAPAAQLQQHLHYHQQQNVQQHRQQQGGSVMMEQNQMRLYQEHRISFGLAPATTFVPASALHGGAASSSLAGARPRGGQQIGAERRYG
jgi:hypothetical protein